MNLNPSIDFIFLLVQILVIITVLVFEIHKDLGDLQGDIVKGVKTIPKQLRIDKTVQVLLLG